MKINYQLFPSIRLCSQWVLSLLRQQLHMMSPMSWAWMLCYLLCMKALLSFLHLFLLFIFEGGGGGYKAGSVLTAENLMWGSNSQTVRS